MGFDIYEDPSSRPTNISVMRGSSRKPLPSGRTPLGKRTNHQEGVVDDNGANTGIGKKKTTDLMKAMESTSNGNTQKRHVHFVDIALPEETSHVSRVASSPLNELRQKLRSTPTVPTPSTPGAGNRPMPNMSPSTLLRTEMDSTPDDSLMLVSPGVQKDSAPAPTRPSLFPLSRLGRGKLLGKPQRVSVAARKEADPSAIATRALNSEERKQTEPPASTRSTNKEEKKPLLTKNTRTSSLLSKRIPKSRGPPKPVTRRPYTSHETRKDTTGAPPVSSQNVPRTDTRKDDFKNDRKAKIHVRQQSNASQRTGLPPKTAPTRGSDQITQKTTIVASATNTQKPSNRAHADANQYVVNTRALQQQKAVPKTQKLISHAFSSRRKSSGAAIPKLQVSTALSPEVPTIPNPPLTQTTQASAWKDTHMNAFAESPMTSTPHGVCMDLSNMFQMAQSSHPVTMAKPKQLQLQDHGTAGVNANCTDPALLASQAQQQCEMFTTWLNATLCPDDDAHAENNPWRSLAVHQRMARVRQHAQAIWQSEEMQKVRNVLQREISKGRLQIRTDRDMYADLTQRKAILHLLMDSYDTPWIRIGLETLFGEAIEPVMQSKSPAKGRFDLKPMEKSTLSRMQVAIRDFIVNRVLSDAAVLAKYTKGKCKVPSGQFEVEYNAEMRTVVLYRIMILFFFLDQAKQAHLLEQTLFRRKSTQKSSKQMLGEFCRLFLASTGDIAKQLARAGLHVRHRQEPLDEVNFAVQNIATDLRDGLRLARLTEVLTGATYQSLLKELRIPAVSRLPKIHNVNVVMDRLRSEFTLPAGVAPHHVVDGHREKVLQLLWSSVAHFCLPSFLQPADVYREIQRIKRSRGELPIAEESEEYQATSGRESELSQLILKWSNAVLFAFGMSVSNLSEDWADGVPCCLLISFYHPELLSPNEIRPTKRTGSESVRKLTVDVSNEIIRQNERENWELAGHRISRLGAMAGVPLADSDRPPNERTMMMALAFLCHRLIVSSVQVQACRHLQRFVRRRRRLADLGAKIAACRVIFRGWSNNKDMYYRAQAKKYGNAISVIECFVLERQWRLKQLKHQRLQREEYNSAATCMQAVSRAFITRRRYVIEVANQRAAIAFQCLWRRTQARRQHQMLLARQEAARFLQSWWRQQLYMLGLRANAATKIQTRWRGFWSRILCDIAVLDAMDLQKYIRRGLAVLEIKRRRRAVGVLQQLARRFLSCQKAFEARENRRRNTAATVFQKNIRQLRCQREYHNLKLQCYSSRTIQSFWRRFVQRATFTTLRAQAIIVQTAIRRYLASSLYLLVIRSCIRVQTFWRFKRAHSSFRLQQGSTLCVQSAIRRWQAERKATSRRKAIVALQCYYRVSKSRRSLQMLKAWKIFTVSQHIQSWWRGELARAGYLRFRNASVEIQSHVRAAVCRRQFQLLRGSAIIIQSTWRCCSVRRGYLTIVRKIALCQSIVRYFIARQLHVRRACAITRLQAGMRMCAAKKRVWREIAKNRALESSSAILIQKGWRSSLARIRYGMMLARVIDLQAFVRRVTSQSHFQKKLAASVLIQSRFRIHLAQKMLSNLQLEYREKLRRETWSATCLQSSVRGHLVRMDLRRNHHAAVLLQKSYRRLAALTKFQTISRATQVIESWARMTNARKEAHRRREAVVCMQGAVRMLRAKTQLDVLRQQYMEFMASVTIQCSWRSAMARGILEELILERWHAEECSDAAVLIQRTFRSYMVSFRAARTIQKNWRCYSSLVNYYWTVLSVYTIQSIARRHFAVQERNSRQYAVYVLQNFGRSIVERRRQERFIKCVIKVQSCVRGHSARREEALRHFAASIVQRCGRGLLVRERVRLWDSAACEIQRLWRGYNVFADYFCTRQSTIIIQAAYRRYLARALRYHLQTENLVETFYLNRCSRIIHSSFRAFIRRRLLEQAALSIQNTWATYWSRRSFSILRRSMVKLQSQFRGYLIRRRRPRKISVLVNRLRRLDTSPHLRLGHRMAHALNIVANSLSLSDIMGAAKTLEVATRWSPECCLQLVQAGATSVLFNLIRTCNRSLPHKEVLQVVLRALLNVCRHCGWDDSCPDGAGACVDLVQIFRDKPEVFVPAVTLLHKAVKSSQQSRDWCGTQENAKRLRNVHALCSRKQPRGNSSTDKTVRKAIKTLLHIVDLVAPNPL